MRLTVAAPEESEEGVRSTRRPLVAATCARVADPGRRRLVHRGRRRERATGARSRPTAATARDALCDRAVRPSRLPRDPQLDVGGHEPGLAVRPAGEGLFRPASRRYSRPADRRPLRPADRERRREDRPLRRSTAASAPAYEAELGPQAFDAALRIRDRIVDSPTTGPRQVYLCHRFCELGAIPIEKAFAEFRDFLAANPDEVLVVVIEDYVEPEDIAAAAEETGLLDYVYDGRARRSRGRRWARWSSRAGGC